MLCTSSSDRAAPVGRHVSTAMTPRRSAADMAVLAHALRAAGQSAAVAQMIRAGEGFDPIVQQLLATRGSLESLLVRLVERELAERDPSIEGVEPHVEQILRTAFDRSSRPSKASRPHMSALLAEQTAA
jgi:DNA-binding FrmR family transcriptional regulator